MGRPPALTRRRFVALSGPGLGALAALAGCGDDEPAGAGAERDLEVLAEALVLERTVVVLYEDAGELLDRPLSGTADLFARHASRRVAALRGEIEARGAVPSEPAPRSAVRRKLRLASVDGPDSFLAMAIRLENTAVAGYTQVVGEISDPDLRRLFYELAESAAAQMTVWLGAAGQVQVPDPLVTGRPA